MLINNTKITFGFNFGLAFLLVEITTRITISKEKTGIEILEIYCKDLDLIIKDEWLDQETINTISSLCVTLTRSQ